MEEKSMSRLANVIWFQRRQCHGDRRTAEIYADIQKAHGNWGVINPSYTIKNTAGVNGDHRIIKRGDGCISIKYIAVVGPSKRLSALTVIPCHMVSQLCMVVLLVINVPLVRIVFCPPGLT